MLLGSFFFFLLLPKINQGEVTFQEASKGTEAYFNSEFAHQLMTSNIIKSRQQKLIPGGVGGVGGDMNLITAETILVYVFWSGRTSMFNLGQISGMQSFPLKITLCSTLISYVYASI